MPRSKVSPFRKFWPTWAWARSGLIAVKPVRPGEVKAVLYRHRNRRAARLPLVRRPRRT